MAGDWREEVRRLADDLKLAASAPDGPRRIEAIAADLRQLAERAEGESDALRQFARWAIAESSFVGCDLDGGRIQDKATELGLLKEVQFTEPCSEEHCACAEAGADFPTTCYRFSEMLAITKTQEAISNG